MSSLIRRKLVLFFNSSIRAHKPVVSRRTQHSKAAINSTIDTNQVNGELCHKFYFCQFLS